MSEHDLPTFTGNCETCRAPIVVGTRCPPCAVESLLRADSRRAERRRLIAEHGPKCPCGGCLRARGEERIERAEVV